MQQGLNLIRSIHVRQTYRKSRGVLICTFEKFKFEKPLQFFVILFKFLIVLKTDLPILCLLSNDKIIYSSKIREKIA